MEKFHNVLFMLTYMSLKLKQKQQGKRKYNTKYYLVVLWRENKQTAQEIKEKIDPSYK